MTSINLKELINKVETTHELTKEELTELLADSEINEEICQYEY